MRHILGTLLKGLIAALPLMITIFIAGWLVGLISSFFGPQSAFGRLLISFGVGIGTSALVAYLIGFAIIVAAIYILGSLVESRLGAWLSGLWDRLIRRVPLISIIYELSSRFVAVIGDNKDKPSLKSMRPVWCFFGGKPGAAVLALQPTTTPVKLGDEDYVGILVPSAPVPFGGALIYVPANWVEPAPEGVDDLVSIYVSMGFTPPQSLQTAAPVGAAPGATAKG